MAPLNEPIDSNWIIRFLHLHCFIHMFRVFRAENATTVFSKPRFAMFSEIKRLFSSKVATHSLFKNLLFTFKIEIFVGMLITFIFASLNLLVPQLTRSFMNYMQDHGGKTAKSQPAQYFTLQFVTLQLLRLIFGEHAKRLFTQLAIKVESTLSKRLVLKSLRLAKQITDRLPQSQIYQLENVDLKLIFLLFKNFYLVFETPFTIVVAIGMMFRESPTYGLVAIYWFLIAFLVQRELDQRMANCNLTKLGLIEQRSKVNYQLLQKIRSAKLAVSEGVLVEKNNDLFVHENHDHHQFYYYSTLYDISLLLLPIAVVVSVSLLDVNENDPITISEVYVMLSLLGICYNPMRNFRTLTLSVHDGLVSLGRITQYFNLPDEIRSQLINKTDNQGVLKIKKGTTSTYPHSDYDFQLVIDFAITINKTERLTIIGKKGQGSSSFIQMIVGNMKKIRGSVEIGGKIAYLPDRNFFSSASVQENMAFFNPQATDQKVMAIYSQLGLDSDILVPDGLSLDMSDISLFTPAQLQKISLGRIFCSEADIYILDDPFHNLDQKSCVIVEQILRKKQKQGKVVITAAKSIELVSPQDYILIIDEGVSTQFGKFSQLIKSEQSQIKHFMRGVYNRLQNQEQQNKIKLLQKFQKSIHRTISLNRALQTLALGGVNEENEAGARLKNIDRISRLKKSQEIKKEVKTQQPGWIFLGFLQKFLLAARLSESIFIYLIIVAAQILHIFIHFFIGHEYEQQQGSDLSSFRVLLVTQVILTLGLSGIIYLEGEVSSHLAIIKGNVLYKQALTSLTSKSIKWFGQQFSVKIADKFNHDYEQVFVAWHSILAIYKNVVILIVTIFFVSADRKIVFLLTFFIAVVYISIMLFLRAVQSRVVCHYYDYKYEFVRVFQESIQGAEIIKIFEVKTKFLERTQEKYTRLAAYKLAQSYTSYGQELACDIASTVLLGFALGYGVELKLHGYSTAVIATTIFLLMNLSQVLKTIVKLTVNLESYFLINLQPFLQVIEKSEQEEKIKQKQSHQSPTKIKNTFKNYDITFNQVMLFEQSKESNQQRAYKIDKRTPLTLQIPEGQKIVLLEVNDILRDSLFLGLTKNLNKLNKPIQDDRTIKIGGKPINQLTEDQIRQNIGVITKKNFFFNGTLRQNLSWKINNFDSKRADVLAKELQLPEDLESYQDLGLDSRLEAVQDKLNSQLSKKIALLRILIIRPRIIIIKDTPSFLGRRSIVQIIENYLPESTIIKISAKMEAAFDMDRIVFFQGLSIKQDGYKSQLENDQSSQIGKLLSQCNIFGYKWSNMACVSPRKYKTKNTLSIG